MDGFLTTPQALADPGQRLAGSSDVAAVATAPPVDETPPERSGAGSSPADVGGIIDNERARRAPNGVPPREKSHPTAAAASQSKDRTELTTDAASTAEGMSPITEPADGAVKATASPMLNGIKQAVGRPDNNTAPSLSAEQVQELRELARASASPEPEVADELSTALGLAQAIRSGGYDVDLAYARLRFVVDCLRDATPKLTLARDERLRLQFDVYKRSGVVSRLLAHVSAGSAVAMVLAALAMSVVIWAAVVLLVHHLVVYSASSLFQDMFFMNGQVLTVVAFGAFLGGVVSIAMRLGEFSHVGGLDPFAMFLTAMFKPLIGVVLSVFVLATLAGGVISLGFLGNFMGWDARGFASAGFHVSDRALYVLWTLSFLAGFSERFALDFVDRAQGIAQGKPDGAATAKG